MSTEKSSGQREKARPGVRMVKVDSDRGGQRLDNFLLANLKGVPRSAIYRLIRTGQVRVNGSRCKAASRLQEGDEVRIPPVRMADRERVTISDRALEQVQQAILFENDDLLVVNKPSGMAVHAGSGLPWGLIDVLRQGRPDQFIELVHRLDRETSGCMVLARNGAALNALSLQFREGTISKSYLCLMNGVMREPVIEVDAPLARTEVGSRKQVEVADHGKPARTRFRLLRAYSDCSYAEAEIFTGRTHQIRAHAKSIGMPLAGDPLYSDKASLKAWKGLGLKRVFLHAHRLALVSPGGEELEFDAALPDVLRQVLDQLEQ